MFELFALLVTSLFLALLGSIVLLRNINSTTSRLFGLLTTSAIVWGVANYATNHIQGYELQLFVNKLSLAIGFLVILSLWLLSLYFPQKVSEHKLQRRISLLVTPILLSIILFTDTIVSEVIYRPDRNLTDINIGSLFYAYVFAAALFFGMLVFNFYRSYKDESLTKLQHQQILYVATGLLLSFVWALSAAAIIPAISNNWEVSKYGPAGSIFTIVFISVAIFRHKLFDLRLVVARSLAYVLSLGVIVLIASGILFVVSGWLENSGVSANYIRIFFVLITILLAISYVPTKRFFGKVTNRIFYRDAYEAQDFLNEFNQVLVSTIEIDKLLSNATHVIEKYVKTDFCRFALLDDRGNLIRISGDGKKTEDRVFVRARKHIKKDKSNVFVTDVLGGRNSELKILLQQMNVGAVFRISKEAQQEDMGYILMGYKKSGNIFNNQDIATMEIVTNELAIAIENALQYEEIQNFAKTLEEKVEVATKDLRKANEKLKELDQTKDDFISMASHQLRTPLTSVKGYVSMVLEGDVGKVTKKQEQLLNQAFVSSQRMVYLIADLLNVSRLKTGKFIIEAKETNLADVIEGEISQLTETAKGRDLEVTYKKPKNFPELMLDETKIRQVIMNFADNAIYYTPSGGHINIILEDKDESIEFRVEDDGIGVPKTEQHHLFNKFYRAGNAKKARPDGTGLGLFMAKKVVVAQGGAIIFRSTEGKGSTFGFSFAKKPLLPKNYKGLVAKESVVEKPKKTTKKR